MLPAQNGSLISSQIVGAIALLRPVNGTIHGAYCFRRAGDVPPMEASLRSGRNKAIAPYGHTSLQFRQSRDEA